MLSRLRRKADTSATANRGSAAQVRGQSTELGSLALARPRASARSYVSLGIAVVFVVGLLGLSLVVGAYDITAGPHGREMFAITRIPRTAALALAGAAMAISGLVMQLLTQNRFVEPTTIGTTEWASLGLLVVMIFWPEANLVTRMTGAIIASFVGTMIFFLFLRRVSLRSSLVVPIVGIMLGSVVGALTIFLALKTNLLQNLGMWFAGSFTSILRGRYEILWLVLFVVIAIFIAADRFTVAGLGEEIATNVGLNYRRVILIGTGLVAIATGIVTVVVGNLPFIGLIVPNIVSMVRGDNLRENLPWVCLSGIGLVAVCDLIGRSLIMPFEIPVSLILGVMGSAVFIVIILRQRRHG
ncbi:MAG: ABC transporter permease [Propionibacteriaceae bacterium]